MRVLHLYANHKWTGPADLAIESVRGSAPPRDRRPTGINARNSTRAASRNQRVEITAPTPTLPAVAAPPVRSRNGSIARHQDCRSPHSRSRRSRSSSRPRLRRQRTVPDGRSWRRAISAAETPWK